MELVRLDKEEAKQLIDEGCDCFLVLTHDLECDEFVRRKRVNKTNGKVLVMNSKTLVLNKDEDEEQPLSILSIYSSFQKDILNIKPIGLKHDMILLQPKSSKRTKIEHIFENKD